MLLWLVAILACVPWRFPCHSQTNCRSWAFTWWVPWVVETCLCASRCLTPTPDGP